MSEDDSNMCSICLSSVDTTTNQCTTACNHKFHTSCLLEATQTNQICPLCRSNLITPEPQPTDIIQNIIQNIKDAYRLDQLSPTTTHLHQNLSDVLTDIITWQDTENILNYLTPLVAQSSQNLHYRIVIQPLDLSKNILNYIKTGILIDTTLPEPNENQCLINILYSLFQYDNNQLLNNLNNAPLAHTTLYHPI